MRHHEAVTCGASSSMTRSPDGLVAKDEANLLNTSPGRGVALPARPSAMPHLRRQRSPDASLRMAIPSVQWRRTASSTGRPTRRPVSRSFVTYTAATAALLEESRNGELAGEVGRLAVIVLCQ